MAYATTTRSTLRTRVRERLLSTFWSDTELNLYISEGLRVWNTLTGYYRTRNTFIVTRQVPNYAATSFNSNVLMILRLSDGNEPLTQATLESINDFHPTWFETLGHGTTNRPQASPYRACPLPSPYRVRPVRFSESGDADAANTANMWFHVGLNNVVLFPLTSYLEGSAYCVEKMPVPDDDGDYIQVAEDDMPAIVDFITFLARLKEGGKEVQDSVPLLANFLTQASKYNAKIAKSAIYRRYLGVSQHPQETPDGNNGPKSV